MNTPKPKKLPSGKWHIDMTLDGQRYYITEATKKDAIARAALIKAEYMNGVRSTPPSRRTLAEAQERYINQRRNVLSPSTIRGYTTIMNTRFREVQTTPLCDIKHWQSIINIEAQLVSAKTLKNAWGFIKAVLKDNGILAPSVSLPQVVRKDYQYLEPDQLQGFLAAIRGHQYEFEYLCGLHGLRRSEILALTRESFQQVRKKGFRGTVIQVRGAVVFDGEKMVRKKENKNSMSRREVPVFIDRLLELLPFHTFQTPTLYMANSTGKQLTALCRKAGLPEMGMHSLRHSFASLCYFLGISEAECMRLGGWSDPSVMRKFYIHLAEREHWTSVEKLKNFVQSLPAAQAS